MPAPTKLDTSELVRQVKALYRQVAQQPSAEFHFPLGRPLAERLGYPADLLDAVPAEALSSFAGVGYALDLAALAPGARVLDLGSGSGTDSFAAAHRVGPTGQVTGIDMTDAQRAKADRLRAGATHIRFVDGRLEELPFDDASFDVVISNGVVNLCPDKARVFVEAARVLAPGGRLALADIVATRPAARDGDVQRRPVVGLHRRRRPRGRLPGRDREGRPGHRHRPRGPRVPGPHHPGAERQPRVRRARHHPVRPQDLTRRRPSWRRRPSSA